MFRLALPLLLLTLSPALADPAPCSPATAAEDTCTCDVNSLHPLQGAVGMEEVREKAADIARKPKKEWKSLERDPVRVVRGPGGDLFITDHHHGADAWRLAGRTQVLCRIGSRPPFAGDAAFWSSLEADGLVRLADDAGHPLTPAQLPHTLAAMPDDPYRSLARDLRDAGGFCRAEMAHKEFAEFTWADWLRQRPELPQAAVAANAAALLPTALKLAQSPAAAAVPGYVGDKPAGFHCAKDW